MVKTIICVCLLLASSAFATNVVAGWAVNNQNNTNITDKTYVVYWPGSAIENINQVSALVHPFHVTLGFTGPTSGCPCIATVDSIALWKMDDNIPFVSGATILSSTTLKINGSACPCSITIPAGTSASNLFLVDTDPESTLLDESHNWAIAVYLGSSQPTGFAISQGGGGINSNNYHVGGMLGGFTAGNKTGNTTLPFGADTADRVFLIQAVAF